MNINSRRHRRKHARFQQIVHDGAVDDVGAEEGPPRPLPKSDYKSIYKWWNDEYRLAVVCVVAAIVLGIIFQKFDKQVVPTLPGNVDFDVIIVAIFTCVRVAMSGIVESSISQAAWIWVSEARQRRTNDMRARLEDFKIYDEASLPALNVSTKAAVYSGILSIDVTNFEVECPSANCTWPIIPTLAVCGECNSMSVRTTCNDWAQTCLYSMPSGTSLDVSQTAPSTERFKVTKSPGIHHHFNSTTQTYISVFDVLWVMETRGETKKLGQECALWFCMQSYNIVVSDGSLNQTLLKTWNTTRFEDSNSAHGDEYVFVDVPQDMNVPQESRYSITSRALEALQRFMDPLLEGTYEKQYTINNFSSEWIEGIYNARWDVFSWIRRLSLSLTNEVRLHGTIRDKQRHRYGGQAYEMAQVILVEWKWLIFPTSLIIISIYYLFQTIIRGARDGISVWKSDSLPMLFCRIDASILARVGDGMDLPNGLDKRVGEVKVCLLREDDGDWVFKPIESEESSSESDSD